MVVSELIPRGRGSRFLSLLAALGLLSSCANHRPEIDRQEEALVTNTTVNGIKLFSCTVSVRDAGNSGERSGGRGAVAGGSA